jgi:hypothetical protein
MKHWTASVVTTGYGQSPNNTQIAAPQTATNQTSESQTSTSSRFMILPDDVGMAANSSALMR